MTIRQFLILACATLFMASHSSHAANFSDTESLFSLSLAELMQVSIASKKDESLIQAPSIMTVLSQDQISQYGFRNLRDVLDRLVNMQVVGSNLYPHNRLSIRGVTQTHTDNKVLMLLNGRVIRDANQGGINSDIYNLLPVEVIKKIEIIRGPGSTLFGTNAFSGVINITTNTADNNNQQISLTVGEQASQSITLESTYLSDNAQAQLVINQRQSQGDTFKNINGEFGTSGDYPMDNKALQILVNGHIDNISLNALISESEQGNIKSLFQFPATTLKIERRHLDLAHSHDFNNKWQLNNSLTYNYHQVSFAISNSRDTRTDSQDYLFESNIKAKLSQTSDFILGITHEKLEGTIGNISATPTHFNTYQSGIFSQIDWQPNERNKVVIGAQYNKSEFEAGKLSPRFSFIHYFNKIWSSKLLYGEAFRAPFATDLFLNSPSLKGSIDLKAETIKTSDFQLIYLTDQTHASATLYFSKHENLHQREDINGTPTFVNKGQIDYYGFEFEYRRQVNNKTELTLNSSYQKNENESGLEGTTYNPSTMLKAGLSHQLNDGLTINIFDSYFSKATEIKDIGDAPSSNNAALKEYHLVSLNVKIKASHFFNNAISQSLDMSLYVDNLLDESVYFTSFNRQNVSSLPHHGGRSLHLSMQYSFQ